MRISTLVALSLPSRRGIPRFSIVIAIGLASCASAPVSDQRDGWPPDADDSCFNNAAAMGYFHDFVERVFLQARIPPPAGFRIVLAPDGTLARFEVDGDPHAAEFDFEPVPVPLDARCITNVTITGVFEAPGEERDAPPMPSLSRPKESVTFDAVVVQILDDANLGDGSHVVRAQLQPVSSSDEPDHPLTVMCWSPPAPICPSTAGETGSFSIYLEPVETRFIVQRYEPARE